jgi:hypothetical protein
LKFLQLVQFHLYLETSKLIDGSETEYKNASYLIRWLILPRSCPCTFVPDILKCVDSTRIGKVLVSIHQLWGTLAR